MAPKYYRSAMPKHADDDLLSAIAATGPEAARLVKELRHRHQGGRRPIPERNYRRLELWWKAFKRQCGSMPEPDAVQKFFRKHGARIERELGIKRGKRGSHKGQMRSLLNAVARGADESGRLYRRRFDPWLIYDILGRPRVERDPATAAYIRAAEEYALLGTGPGQPLVHFFRP
jgi:hypothetical protein